MRYNQRRWVILITLTLLGCDEETWEDYSDAQECPILIEQAGAEPETCSNDVSPDKACPVAKRCDTCIYWLGETEAPCSGTYWLMCEEGAWQLAGHGEQYAECFEGEGE